MTAAPNPPRLDPIPPVLWPEPPLAEEQARELLEQFGSPLYVYQADRLRQTLDHITRAIAYPHTAFHFAVVTNGNVVLLQQMRLAGWGLHANTPGDVYLGLRAGFDPRQIVYSGSNLSRAEMAQVLDWGLDTFNLDSLDQLRLLGQVYAERPAAAALRLGLRLNLPELTGDSRIGVRPEEFGAAQTMAQSAGLTISGLHFYRGTGTNATGAFTDAIAPLLANAQQLPDWCYLDIGGGFGYPYRHDGAAFDWSAFGAELMRQLTQVARPVQLVIEPGRAAIAGCGTLLTQVVAVKWQGDKQIVGVDTTVANLSVPAVHGGYRTLTTWAPPGERFLSDICGNTTYSRDYLGRQCWLPALRPGNRLAVLDVGAYGYSMSSHFLHRPRPAEVLLEASGPRLIRQREDYDVLLAHQVWEEPVR